MLAFLLVIEDVALRSKLEEIYYCYNKDLYYTAYEILKDHHEAQDVVQDAIVRIANNLDKIIDIKCKKTRAYLVIIVRNLSYDVYNKKKRITSTPFDEINELEIRSKVDLEDHVLRLEESKEMAIKLNEVNKTHADILALRYFFEYTVSEIAGVLDISEGNVYVRIHRAKEALKDILNQGGRPIEKARRKRVLGEID